MSQELINSLTQKVYKDAKKFAEIAAKADGKHKSVLLRKAKMLMKKSELIAAGK